MSNPTTGTGQRSLPMKRPAPADILTITCVECDACDVIPSEVRALDHPNFSVVRWLHERGWTLHTHHGQGICPDCMRAAMEEHWRGYDDDANTRLLIQESYK